MGGLSMFNNLIESGSHTRELKRRSSFFIGALGVYGLLFMAIGVVGVFAYDARLDRQNLELVSLVALVEPAVEQPRVINERPRPSSAPETGRQIAMRTAEPPSADPTKTNIGTSVTTNQPPPVKTGSYVLGTSNLDPDAIGGIGNSSGSGSSDGTVATGTAKEIEPPPVKLKEPKVEKKPTLVSKGVINGLAKSLPPPPYPQMAKISGVSGLVTVQVLIDELGNVISARAVSGHPLLQAEAVKAAYRAKFTTTYLSDVPVKVSGVINYNFKRD
jgi:protein TonB